MTDEASQPPLGWRYCGNQIKLWRTGAGFTREELAKEAGHGYATIESMELGRRRPTERVLQIADEMFGARGKLLAGKEYLQPESVVPVRTQEYMRYEAKAVAVSTYRPLTFPGLLQTEETMRTMFATRWPPLDDESIDELVAVRLARQPLLQKPTTSFNFIIQEAVLHHQLAGSEAHRRQLRRLLEVGGQRNVNVQVMETGGCHSGLSGSFSLLDLPDHDRLAYVEGQLVQLLYGSAEQVSLLSQRFAAIAGQALRPKESAEIISRLAETL
ncbi:helix-turn-helix transcriptional regulator [Streptomyces sp. ET3-23]|uniref:helix-turn-helix domain-containing protein n=1 Tax=Streptomyces sp. ET3-23 TaxID=2885643 RepID=UPI001D1224DE|nr:helix-turn-helix transcriptional regulator [Streptomyces sp. ET3-23]MCC2274852.1 helix-turn-helix transcriptional regulator [Streptomyces sp. ET3-23]